MSKHRRAGLLTLALGTVAVTTLASGLFGYTIGIAPEDRQWMPEVEPGVVLLAVIVGLVGLGYLMTRLPAGNVAGPLFIALLAGLAISGCVAGFFVGAIPRIH